MLNPPNSEKNLGRRARIGVALLLATTLSFSVTACTGDDGIGDSVTGKSSGSATEVKPVKIEAAGNGFDFATVYRETVPGVISVRSIFGTGAAGGSGFVLGDEGEIVTNAHVITDG